MLWEGKIMADNNPCSNCSLREMFKYGCCTHFVPEGAKCKCVVAKRFGRVVARYEVCEHLVVGEGAPYCGIYLQRDDNCRSWDCAKVLKHRAKRE